MVNAALDKFPTYGGVVYRNIGFDSREYFEDFILKHQGVDTIKYEALTSASKSPDGYPVELPYTVRYIIQGYSCKDVSRIGILEEHEVLFKSGAEFRINSFEVNGNEIQIQYEELKTDGTELLTSFGENRNEGKSNVTGEQDSSFRTSDEANQGLGGLREGSGSANELSDTESAGERRNTGENSSSDSVELREDDRYVPGTQGVLQRKELAESESLRGEISSLKHTRSVYSLFKGAARVVVGKDDKRRCSSCVE